MNLEPLRSLFEPEPSNLNHLPNADAATCFSRPCAVKVSSHLRQKPHIETTHPVVESDDSAHYAPLTDIQRKLKSYERSDLGRGGRVWMDLGSLKCIY